jgi:hypothetical protein
MVLTKWSQTFDRNLGKAFSLQIEDFDFLSSFRTEFSSSDYAAEGSSVHHHHDRHHRDRQPLNVFPDVAALKMNIAYAYVAYLFHANRHQHHHQVVYREALHVYATTGGTSARATVPKVHSE